MRNLAILLVVVAALFPNLASGAESFVLIQVRNKVPATAEPGIRVTAQREVTRFVLGLKRSDGTKIERRTTLANGETKELTWSQAPGTMGYKGEAWVEYRVAEPSRILLDFTVTVTDRLKVRVDRGGFSLAKRLLRFSGTRRLIRAKIEVRDPYGKVLGRVDRRVGRSDTQGRYEATWEQEPGEVGKVILTAYDTEGYWAQVEVIPFAIFIPHDEVVFRSGSASIRRSERPKLRKTLDLIQEAIQRNAEIDDLRLYVAGYTDTVSGRRYNLRLSRQRARSIGRHFQRLGLKIPIFYQGFGEEVLAVGTPDATPEKRNRRAIYMLSNHTPAISKHFPKSDWQRVGQRRRKRRHRRRRRKRRRRKRRRS